jgi:cytochrome c oxidase subunit 2
MTRSAYWRGLCLLTTGGVAVLALAGCNAGPDSFDTVSPQGDSIAHLFLAILVVSGVIAIAVAGAVLFLAWRFRAREGVGPPRPTSGSVWLQVAYVGGPFLLFCIIGIYMVRTMNTVEGGSATADLHIQVVGHQWWWEFDYPDLGVVTANELHVPTDTSMRLDITGADVIHSFWVPQFGWKMDAIPGRTTTMTVTVDRTGVFDGTCTEFCGAGHAWMRIRVVAEPRAQFDAWVAQQRQTATVPTDAVTQQGLKVFLTNTCVTCHTIRFDNGSTTTSPVGPDLTHLASRATIGSGVLDNTAANLKDWIKNPDAIKPNALMPGFPNLSDQDLVALVHYLEELR